MNHTAIYPGSFDPPTLAHMDILAQALFVFERVFVVIAKHGEKNGKFNSAQRLKMWEATGHPDVVVVDPGTCVAEWAAQLGTIHVVRGIRSGDDVQAEQAYKQFVHTAGNGIVDLVYFLSPPKYQHVSSTAVRQILQLRKKSLLDGWVDPRVADLALKYQGNWVPTI